MNYVCRLAYVCVYHIYICTHKHIHWILLRESQRNMYFFVEITATSKSTNGPSKTS